MVMYLFYIFVDVFFKVYMLFSLIYFIKVIEVISFLYGLFQFEFIIILREMNINIYLKVFYL